MNAQENPTVPAYKIEATDPSGKARPISRTFMAPCLLTARHKALQHVQGLQANMLKTQSLNVSIHLVEIDKTVIPSSEKSIATIFQKRFPATLFIPGGTNPKDDPANILPPSVKVTTDPTDADEAYSSLQAVWDSLQEMDQECGYYYTNGHEAGLGYVQLDQIVGRRVLEQTPIEDLQSLPTRTYTVLQDGFAYAASLISNFNDRTANDDDVLSFNTLFIPGK